MDHPCFCRPLHAKCAERTDCGRGSISAVNLKFQIHQGVDTYELGHLLQAAKRGCGTCSALYWGLQVPAVKKIWTLPDWPGKPDESKVLVKFVRIANGREGEALSYETHGYVILRLLVEGWRHFIFTRDNREGHIQICEAFGKLERRFSSNTGSTESFDALRRWMSVCNSNHHCWNAQVRELPTRVLRIYSDRVRLERGNGRKAPYTTLSHRWGGRHVIQLTSQLQSIFEAGIPFADLPVTYQDAIQVTRELEEKVDFIWIDSLCIIQDSKEDWESESVRMLQVYGGSYLNIAASHAMNDSEGCLGPYSEPIPEEFAVSQAAGVYVREISRSTHHDFGSKYRPNPASAPLLQRAWVLQERLLCPRMVYFAKTELLWECNEVADCQCAAITVMSPVKSFWQNSILGLPPLYDVQEPLIYAWMRVIIKYSEMDLSFENDRLVALSGVAQQVLATGQAGCYVAGLWSEKLEHQICWSVVGGHRKPQRYLGPSWSWVSVFGGIDFSNRADIDSTGCEISARILDVKCTLRDSDEETGPVLDGTMTVFAHALPLTATVIGKSNDDKPAKYSLHHLSSHLPRITFQPDTINNDDTIGLKRDILLIFWGKMFRWDQATFLILQKSPDDLKIDGKDDGTKYQRLGLLQFLGMDKFDQAEPLLHLCKSQKAASYTIV